MEESRRIAYNCIYCGLEMSDGNSLQLHFVNCAEIGQDEEFVSHTPKEPHKSWKEQEEEEENEREKWKHWKKRRGNGIATMSL